LTEGHPRHHASRRKARTFFRKVMSQASLYQTGHPVRARAQPPTLPFLTSQLVKEQRPVPTNGAAVQRELGQHANLFRGTRRHRTRPCRRRRGGAYLVPSDPPVNSPPKVFSTAPRQRRSASSDNGEARTGARLIRSNCRERAGDAGQAAR
jgi:hypothetical protein